MASFISSLSPDSDALAIFVNEKYSYKDKKGVLPKKISQKIDYPLDQDVTLYQDHFSEIFFYKKCNILFILMISLHRASDYRCMIFKHSE